jgi:hypothetical protein
MALDFWILRENPDEIDIGGVQPAAGFRLDAGSPRGSGSGVLTAPSR